MALPSPLRVASARTGLRPPVQHLVSTWPGAPSPRQTGGSVGGLPRNQTDAHSGAPGHRRHRAHPKAAHRGMEWPDASQPQRPRSAAPGALPGCPQPLRMAWTWGTSRASGEPGSIARRRWRGCVPQGPAGAPPGPDPHTTENPNGAEILARPRPAPPRPGGRWQFLTCTVLLYQERLALPLYHKPLNGVNFLIIYIKINIYKYI